MSRVFYENFVNEKKPVGFRNLNSDVPVQWQIGSKKLIPELLVAESKGRIYISITDKIHIKDAKISDSNVYRY